MLNLMAFGSGPFLALNRIDVSKYTTMHGTAYQRLQSSASEQELIGVRQNSQ